MCTVPALAEENLSGTTGPDDHAGLKGEYYDNQDLTNLKLTRTDPKVDFSWGSGSPDPSIAPDTFSVRWTGEVKADHTQTYTFSTVSDDGIRLWVGGALVIDNWTVHPPTGNTGTVTLQAGQWYPLTLEYFEAAGGAVISLAYASPSTPKQTIPSDHLRPVDTTAPTVVQTAPAAGASAVAGSANVEATFSEAMSAASITSSTFALQKQGAVGPVAAAVSYDAAAKKAILNPNVNLDAGASYTATVTGGAAGAKDLAGNALAVDKVWSFTVAAAPPPSTQQGLKGDYFNNQNLTALVLTRLDPTVNFNWGGGAPAASIAPDTFSVRWTGEVKADHTQTYTFSTVSNDGVRLWIGGTLLIDDWIDHPPTEKSGSISLQAGQWYPVTLEYYEGVGTSVVSLSYASASTAKQIVPADHLRPAP
jgi:hypothetical protein